MRSSRQHGGHVAVHEPRRDHVRGDVPRAELAGERPGEADQARLGGGVVGLAAGAVQADDGGDEDHPAAAHLHHAAHRALGDPVGAGQVGVEHVGEGILLDQRQQLVLGDPGVGDEHLDRTLVLLDRGERGVNGRGVPDVARTTDSPSTGSPDREVTVTLSPSAASRRAIASPIPRFPPVTSAERPTSPSKSPLSLPAEFTPRLQAPATSTANPLPPGVKGSRTFARTRGEAGSSSPCRDAPIASMPPVTKIQLPPCRNPP